MIILDSTLLSQLQVFLPFSRYVYDADGDPLQTFDVENKENTEEFEMVELDILSNHGNMEYTCLYRFRVHGK